MISEIGTQKLAATPMVIVSACTVKAGKAMHSAVAPYAILFMVVLRWLFAPRDFDRPGSAQSGREGRQIENAFSCAALAGVQAPPFPRVLQWQLPRYISENIAQLCKRPPVRCRQLGVTVSGFCFS